MSEGLRDPRVKVWPLSRIVMLTIVYVVLATGAAWISIGVAMDRARDMGHYQVEKTREFLGRERAKELEAFMQGGAAAEGAAAEGTGGEGSATEGTGEEAPSGLLEVTPPAQEE